MKIMRLLKNLVGNTRNRPASPLASIPAPPDGRGGESRGRAGRSLRSLRQPRTGALLAISAAFLIGSGGALANPGDISIDIMVSPNLIIDSNVTSSSTASPSAASIGANICNETGLEITNITVNIGNNTAGTPGLYPLTLAADTDYSFDAGSYSLTHEGGSLGTRDATRTIRSLGPHECRMVYWLVSYPRCMNDTSGNTIEPPCSTESIAGGVKPDDDFSVAYDIWVDSDHNSDGAQDGNGSVKSADFTFRNTISAMANKIQPNGDNKVPQVYIDAINESLGWSAVGPTGLPVSTNPVYPGQKVITTKGIWYDLGNVGEGFDNDGDGVYDRNAWLQPIGDPGGWDAGCYRLVNSFGLVIVKLNDGTEKLLPANNKLYFTDIPGNNTGAVGLIYYQFIALKTGCGSSTTPYQQVASGADNEKFNSDFGMGFSFGSNVSGNSFTLNKDDGVDPPFGGNTLTYTLTTTNTADAPLGAPEFGAPLVFQDTVSGDVAFISRSAEDGTIVGAENIEPSGRGTPLDPGDLDAYDGNYDGYYIVDYASDDATETECDNSDTSLATCTSSPGSNCGGIGETPCIDTCPIRYEIASSEFVPVYSTDNGATFSPAEPATAADTTDIQWQLFTVVYTDGGHDGANCVLPDGDFNDLVDVQAEQISLPGGTCWDGGTACKTASVTFQADLSTTTEPEVCNTGHVGFAVGADPAESAEVCTLLEGDNRIVGTVYQDNGGTTGILGNGIQDGDEAGMGSITLSLYYDRLGDGDVDADDILIYTTTSSGTDGSYVFGDNDNNGSCADAVDTCLPDGNYIVVVDTSDTDITTGYTNSTPYYVGIDLDSAGTCPSGGATATCDTTTDNPNGIYTGTANFGFAPALDLTKDLTTPGDVYIGDTVTFDIDVSNVLPGSGTASANYCTVTRWASTGVALNQGNNAASYWYTDGGTTQAVAADLSRVLGPPDQLYLDRQYNGQDNVGHTIVVGGFNIPTPASSATISSVKVVLYSWTDLDVTDDFVRVQNNNTVTNALLRTDLVGSVINQFSPGLESAGETELDITGVGSTWTFADLTGLRVDVVNPKGTDADNRRLYVDAIGLRVTYTPSDGSCTPTASTTLNPVPLTDSFVNTELQFVSSVPPITGSQVNGTSTKLYWDNIGALYPGQTKTVSLQFKALAVATDSTDTAESKDAKYADGRAANTPVSDTADVDILDTPAQSGTIQGTVWDNDIVDATIGATEARLADVRVTLWACKKATGFVLDTGNIGACTEEDGSWVAMRETYTDLNGFYQFASLPFGFYYTEVDTDTVPTGATNNYDPDGNIDDQSNTGAEDLDGAPNLGAVDTNGEIITLNFGYAVAPPTDQLNIGDTLYYDWDGDGTQDAGDGGIPNVTINLYDRSGVLLATTATDGDGYYLFSGLSSGRYQVRVDIDDPDFPSDSLKQTADPEEPGVTCSSCDNMGLVELVDTSISTVDFGYLPQGACSISDYVWWDQDSDGIKDAGEPGIDAVTVTLYADFDGDGVYTSIMTDESASDGAYNFTGLISGDYRVVVSRDDTDLEPTAASTNATEYDVRLSNCGGTAVGAISGTVYSDTHEPDNNAISTSDTGMPGVRVELYASDGTTLLDFTYTDSNGGYLFEGLAAASYVVKQVVPTGVTAENDEDGSGNTVNYIDTSVTAGLTTTSQDFLNDTSATIRTIDGYVYEDSDTAGTTGAIDGADIPISGVTVKLYADADADGNPDSAVPVATTTTNASGFYEFTAIPSGTIPSGTYVVIETDPAGMESVTDTDTADIDNDGAIDEVTQYDNKVKVNVSEGDSSGNNFLDQGQYDITGTVRNDANGDGVTTGGDAGIDGVTVELFADTDGDGLPDGTPLDSVTTAGGGLYSFTGYANGDYVVVETDLGTYSSTVDIDGNTVNNWNQVAVTLDGADSTGNDFWDALNTNTGLGDISGTVYVDADADLILETSDTGLEGVTITLYLDANGDGVADGPALDSTVTAGDGNYSFTDLPPNTYLVVETQPASYTSITDSEGDRSAPAYDKIRVTVSANTVNTDNDFLEGANTATGTISGTVWDDGGPSGTGDDNFGGTGDSGIPGVTVKLYVDSNNDGVADSGTPVATTVTDANGDYSFIGIPDGRYIVVETDPKGAVSELETNTNDDGDANNNVIKVDISGGGDSADNDFLDDGVPVYDISGRVEVDADLDGDFSDADAAIADGTSVALYSDPNGDGDPSDGVLLASTTTSGGDYSFTGYPNGNYVVVETNPANYVSTNDLDGETSNSRDQIGVTLNGANSTGNDFLDGDVSGFTNASISGTVRDDDGDGRIEGDSVDPGISGVTVTLYADTDGDGKADGLPLATATTDDNGRYSFDNLAAGDYVVVETDPAGKFSSADIDTDRFGDGADNGKNQIGVTLAASEAKVGQDFLDDDNPNFGFNQLGNLGDTIFYDANENGTQDVSESGISGVIVQLFTFTDDGDGKYDPDSAGDSIAATPIATVTTDANGVYLFEDLEAGNYVVKVANSNYLSGGALDGGTLTADPDADGSVFSDPVLRSTFDNLDDCETVPNSDESACDGLSGISLETGQSNYGMDFGYKLPFANIGDRVWLDVNGDANQYVGGAVVSVINGALDMNGVDGVTLDDDGYFQGYQVIDGYLDVNGDGIIASDAGYVSGSDNLSSITTSEYSVVDGLIFNGGAALAGPTNVTAVKGLEPGLGGVTVTLKKCTNAPTCDTWTDVATTDTDGDGYYLFPGVASNTTYRVVVDTGDLPSGVNTTPTYEGGDTTLNSDLTAVVGSGVVTSLAGDGCTDCDLDADFGYPYDNSYTITGTVCLDDTSSVDGVCNGAGAGTSGNESPFTGVTVTLYKFEDNAGSVANEWEQTVDGEKLVKIGETTTDASGNYSIGAPTLGGTDEDYIVVVGAPAPSLAATTSDANKGADVTNTQQTLDALGYNKVFYQVIDTEGKKTNVDFAYEISVSYDLGDLPGLGELGTTGDWNYDRMAAANSSGFATTVKSRGARHSYPGTCTAGDEISTVTVWLGGVNDNPTCEDDGKPSADASLDGKENGVTWDYRAMGEGLKTTFTVTVTASAAKDAYVVGYIDWNQDGDFGDIHEYAIPVTKITLTAANTPVSRDFEVTIPERTANGAEYTDIVQLYKKIFMRFRVFTEAPALPGLTNLGTFTDGEVEDYVQEFAVDFGDAPISFGTDWDNPTYNLIPKQVIDAGENPTLGTIALNDFPNPDVDGSTLLTGVDAGGNNPEPNADDDENGQLDFFVADPTGTGDDGRYTAWIKVKVHNPSTTRWAQVVAWADFNNDGVFTDASAADDGERSDPDVYYVDVPTDGEYTWQGVVRDTRYTLANDGGTPDDDNATDGSFATGNIPPNTEDADVWLKWTGIDASHIKLGYDVITRVRITTDRTNRSTNGGDDSFFSDSSPSATGSLGDGETQDSRGTTGTTHATLSDLIAYTSGGNVLLEWTTMGETGTVGFHVERLAPETGEFTRLNEELLVGLLDSPQGGTYQYYDLSAEPGRAYTWRIVEVETTGRHNYYGPWTLSTAATSGNVRRPTQVYSKSMTLPSKATLSRVANAQRRRDAANRAAEPNPNARFDHIKVLLGDKGLYRIQRDDLAAVFGETGRLSNEWLANNPITISHRGRPVSVIPGESKTEFYLFAPEPDSPYIDEGVYLLERTGRAQSAWRLNTQPGRVQQIEHVRYHTRVEEDRHLLTGSSLPVDGDLWAMERFFAQGADETKSFAFDAPNLLRNTYESVQLTLEFVGMAENPQVKRDHIAQVSVNGYGVGSVEWDGRAQKTGIFSVPASYLNETNNQLRVTMLAPSQGYSWVYLDSFSVEYSGDAVADNGVFNFKAHASGDYSVRGFASEAVMVLDVTDPNNPAVIDGAAVEADGAGWRVLFPAVNRHEYYIAALDAVPEIAQAQMTRIALSDLRAVNNRGEFLVIAPEFMRDSAQRYADYRRSTGYASAVVTLEEIYELFGYGYPDPQAIREFLQYAYQRWQAPPAYVLLAGKASIDYKDVYGMGGNITPTLLISTEYGIFPADGRFADLTGDDGVPEIAIGRLPVLDSLELDAYLEKLKVYEGQAGGDFSTDLLMVADKQDAAGDFVVDSDNLIAFVPADASVATAYNEGGNGADVRGRLLSSFYDGTMMINYLGHGTYRAMGKSYDYLDTNDAVSLSNNSSFPFLNAMTCSIGRHNSPFITLAEELTTQPGGGVIAAYAPGGLSLHSHALRINQALFEELFEGARKPIGEVVKSAQQQYAAAPTLPYMQVMYTLFGDPAVVLH